MKLVVVFASKYSTVSLFARQSKTTKLVTLLTAAVEWLLLLRNRKVLGSAAEAYYPAWGSYDFA